MDKDMENVKSFLTYSEQLALLEEKGLIIGDRERAKDILSTVNYYRLINAYALGLYEDSQKTKFIQGVTFDQIYSIYLFDSVLRHVLSEMLESFETLFRAKMINYIGEKYGALGYRDSANFRDENYHHDFIEELDNEKKKQGRSPVVAHHEQKYGGYLPIWAVAEVITFGNLSKLYKNMKSADKKKIAKDLKSTSDSLGSWLVAFVEVRNICAHYGRLYNKRLLSTPKLFSDFPKSLKPDRIFTILFILKRFFSQDDLISYIIRIQSALLRYPKVNLSCIGFPHNWEDMLLDR